MLRQRHTSIAVACGLVVALLGTATAVAAQAQPQTLQLTAQNNSGITGTASFTASGSSTRVEIRVSGAGAGPEPAHIHEGSCAQLNPTPQYTLQPVTNGASTTDVSTNFGALTASPHAVHIHKSADELSVYVACADIKPTSLPRSGDADSWAGVASGAAGLGLMGLGGLLVWRGRRRPA